MSLENIRIVLARPSEPRNVGAVCRAMKNSGLSRLSIVAPDGVDEERARPLAVAALDVLEQAVITADLPSAIRGSSMVAGVTRRTGKRRKAASFRPWEFATQVTGAVNGTSEQGIVSVVFGNEQSGLSDEELQLCQMAVAIPTSDAQPSLNLSHAVQVIGYELYIADRINVGRRDGVALAPRIRPRHRAIDIDQLDRSVDAIIASMHALGFQTQPGPQGMRAFLMDTLGRAMLTKAEVDRFQMVFSKIAGMHGVRPKTP